MEWMQFFAILLTAVAGFRCVNERFLKLQTTIAMVVLCVICLIASWILQWAEVGQDFGLQITRIADLIDDADPSECSIAAALTVLLFATTMQISLAELGGGKWIVLGFASVTLCVATTIIGHLLPWALEKVDIDLSLYSSLLFGAMISATCYSVILEVMQKPPPNVATLLRGESLYLVALSVLACTVIVAAELGDGGELGDAGSSLVRELFRGGLIGAAIGAAGYFSVTAAKTVATRVLVTFAVLYASYAVAVHYDAFAPLAAVLAGMVLCLRKDLSKDVAPLWRCVEETLTTILLVVVGAQLLDSGESMITPILVAVCVVVAGRAGAVCISTQLFGIDKRLQVARWQMIKYASWGAVHGGIPLALALTIDHDGGEELLFLTFGVVVFSLVVQGLTINRV